MTEVEWLPIRTPTTYRNLTATVSIRIKGRESRLPLPDARAVIAKSELQQATHCLRKAIMRIRQHKHHSMASDRMGRSQSEVSDRQQRKSGSAGLLHSCLEMPIQARVLENELEVFRGRVFSIFHFRHHYFRCIGQRAANGIQHHSEKIQSFRKRLRLRFAAQPAHLPLPLASGGSGLNHRRSSDSVRRASRSCGLPKHFGGSPNGPKPFGSLRPENRFGFLRVRPVARALLRGTHARAIEIHSFI